MKSMNGIERRFRYLAKVNPRSQQATGDDDMTRETFEQSLELFMARRPFVPIVVELNVGQRFEIDAPLSIACSEGKAVFIGPGGVMRIFDNESVLQIIDAPAHTLRSRKPKK